MYRWTITWGILIVGMWVVVAQPFPQVEPYLWQGAQAIEQGHPEKGIHLLNISLKIDRDNPYTYLYRGLAYYHLQKYRHAVRDFRKAIRRDSTLVHAYANLSNAYNKLGKHRKAIRVAERGLHFDPRMPHLYNAIGVAYWNQHYYDLALRYFKKSVEVDSTYSMGYNNLAAAIYANQNIAAAHRRDVLRAIRYFRRSLRLDPHMALAHRNLGAMWLSLQQPAQAIDHFYQAIRLDPADAASHALLGQAHYALRHYGNAIEAWQHAQSLDSDRKGLDIDIGNAFLRLHHYDSAQYYYRRAIKHGRYWKGLAYYNLACLASLQDNLATAYQRLKKSYRKGYLKDPQNWEWMKQDPDLENFRNSRWYLKLLEWIN